MFDDKTVSSLAHELHAAEKSRIPIRQFSSRFPDMSLEDGYRVGREWVRIKTQEGQIAKGRKIGLTSRAMQKVAQITEPDYGVLMDEMFYKNGCLLYTSPSPRDRG